MMKHVFEEPTITLDKSPIGGEVYSHPAYAQIGASRVSGHTNLYGSEFVHNNFISIRINRSKTSRSLSRDWMQPKEELIEVMLSEAQWATFVSSMNIGGGVGCTLYSINREYVPQIPIQKDKKEQFSNEISEKLERAIHDLKSLKETLSKSNLSKKAQDEMIRTVNHIENNISGNINYVAESFGEHMEKVTEKAKIEINSYMTGVIQRTGIEALQNGAPILQLSELPESKLHK